MGAVLTHALHMPAATAAALPPELPPAERCTCISGVEEDEADLKGFETGPWMEWMFIELRRKAELGLSER